VLADLLTKPFAPRVDVAEEIDTQLSRLEPYEDVTRFEDNYLFCLAHLYSIGKGVVMLRLADEGVFEFNRERAFEEFERLHPLEGGAAERIRALRPFYNLVTERRPEPLPFSYRKAG